MIKKLLVIGLLACAASVGGCAAQLPSGQALAPHAGWEHSQGGIVGQGVEVDRSHAALERVATGLEGRPLSVHVLETEKPVAFSFPDGSIYVGRGLVDQLSDDELAGALAHELGHLLHDGAVQAPVGLRGVSGGGDIERCADLLGRELLQEHRISPAALTSALVKVTDASRGTVYCAGLEARVNYLQHLDSSSR